MQMIDRQMALLDALAQASHEGGSLRALAAAVEMAPSSTHRLLQGLAAVGLVARDPVGRTYRLGPSVLRLAGAYLERVGFADVVLPYLDAVTAATGTVTFSAVRDGDAVICTSVRAPRETTNFYVRIGKILPWHASAAAKALIAGMEPESLRRHLAPHMGQRYTARTRVDVEDVLADLEGGRRRGYWECVEELEPDVYAVAAPILASGDRPVASLTAVCHVSRRRGDLPQIAERVVAAAAEASIEVAALLHAGQLMEAAS